MVALTGPSGVGKTTAVEVLLGPGPSRRGFRAPSERWTSSTSTGVSLWSQVSWLPQRPVLEPGHDRGRSWAVGTTSRPRSPGSTPCSRRCRDGWQTELGRGGEGLSLGQRQRVALTRALVSDAPLVILDEPTAHLDAAGETVVLDTVRALRESGRTVLLVAHRPSLVACADTVVEVRSDVDSAVPA